MNSNYRTVFSTDPKDQLNCPSCKKLKSECKCPKKAETIKDGTKINAHVRLEKNGRGGKTVTIIEHLPKNLPFLQEMTKGLKSKCGAGGTCFIEDKGGIIEIQGDQRKKIALFLLDKGIKFKGNIDG